MAFASGQPGVLQVITGEMDANADPELVARCAEFFVRNEQSLRAVQLLAKAHRYAEALQVCAETGVPLTEELAEALTPLAVDMQQPLKPDDETERKRLLVQLGELLHRQGDYHTATKKFTQAGDKQRAMRALLKSGDTEKIVFFASMSRQPDVFIMAANYLQSLRWHGDAKIYKNIISFYGRAQAFEQLANFHVTCAQMEIAQHRDYGRALAALQEAQASLAKVMNGTDGAVNVARATENLQATVTAVRRVAELQQSLERGEFANVVAMCRSLLGELNRKCIAEREISNSFESCVSRLSF